MAGGIRRSLMQSDQARPLEDGDLTFTTYNNRAVVSEGRKFHGYITGNSHSMIVNIANLSENTDTANADANNLSTKTFFTIKKGSRLFTRFTPTYVYGSNSTIKGKYVNATLRKPDGTSILTAFTHQKYSDVVVGVPIEKKWIAPDDTQINVLGVYMEASSTAKAQLDFIVEIFIDGRRIV